MKRLIRADICVAALMGAGLITIAMASSGQFIMAWSVAGIWAILSAASFGFIVMFVGIWAILSAASFGFIVMLVGPFKTYKDFKFRKRSRVSIRPELFTQEVRESLRIKEWHFLLTIVLLVAVGVPIGYFAFTMDQMHWSLLLAGAGLGLWCAWLSFLASMDRKTLQELVTSAQDQSAGANPAGLEADPE